MQFKEGDLVLIRLHHLWQTSCKKGGLFKVLKQFGTNFYLIDLPSEFHINLVFNVADLTTYHSPLPSVKSAAPTNIPHVQPITEVAYSILTHQFVFLKL